MFPKRSCGWHIKFLVADYCFSMFHYSFKVIIILSKSHLYCAYGVSLYSSNP